MMDYSVQPFLKPGMFSVNASADSRRNEFDCKNQVIVQKQIPVDFVFIGDSITHMWELNAYFNKPNQMILNRGIGGDRTEFLLKRFMADVVQLKPKHCIMKIGINDAWDLEFDHWQQLEGKSLQEILNVATNNLEQLVALAKDNATNLILCSVLPTNMAWTNKEELRKEYVKLLNQNIKKLAKENGFIYVDYHTALVKEDGLTVKESITIEGLHPNVFGYDIMAKVLRQTLAENDIEI
ncbi:G-D-S-L family lipolytic protein [Sporanaerobium hydrogeniformans]|uniref:G-D-S-L family lipolytic protein n=1 Tax=Sporanaerobium hydrogeniformans TaxID=3072179 RepID=A0AC61DEB7_9FIRM|nr:GDSL-type esterase/lipase family protein [Sporanaerobium hydrogeniformans]PHV71168.1 G-D-S-L family lipolytic protein [Sporanaerobium hydrogeniformans]